MEGGRLSAGLARDSRAGRSRTARDCCPGWTGGQQLPGTCSSGSLSMVGARLLPAPLSTTNQVRALCVPGSRRS
jgi:hypothetical protein